MGSNSEKTIFCQLCTLRFTNNSTYNIHFSLLHDSKNWQNGESKNRRFMLVSLITQGKEPFVCSVCSSGFAVEKHLTKHDHNLNSQRLVYQP